MSQAQLLINTAAKRDISEEPPLFWGKEFFSSSYKKKYKNSPSSDEGKTHAWVNNDFLMKNSSSSTDEEARVWVGRGFLVEHHTVLEP